MSFPACKHRIAKPVAPAAPGALTWLAAEPFRLFFFSGAGSRHSLFDFSRFVFEYRQIVVRGRHYGCATRLPQL